jgi:hypothetical protein
MMKTIIKILVSIVILYLSVSMLAQNQKPVTESSTQSSREEIQEPDIDIPDEDTPEMEDEDFYPYDQGIISRKLFQKKLAPLSRKQKIKWSFRLAETNSFL